ncbi:amino acid ABC transporter permease [Streptomyces sp. NPDC002643]
MNLDVLLTILQGAPVTLMLTAAAMGIGIVGGIPLALARRSGRLPVRFAARCVIELLRGIPPIVWLFVIIYGLGPSMPQIDPMTGAVVGLGVVSAAYMAEIYRGGVAAVHQGQWEASAALGMSGGDTLTRIVGPQVVRVSIPAAATYAIGLIKDSSVVFTIGVTELMYWANDQSRSTTDAIGPFLLVGAVYITMSVLCAWGARSLDAHLRKRVAR